LILRLKQYLKRNDIRIWELAFALGFIAALIIGVSLHGSQESLADKLVRFHVIANSDSQDDQALKLSVRDSVLELTDSLLQDKSDVQSAAAALEKSLPAIKEAAQDAVYAQGYDYPVDVTVTQAYFPTRDYDTFCLPAGTYNTLRVTIGEGEGQNWWCVVFPPLCFSAAQDFDRAAEAASLSEDEIKLITEDGTSYQIKFQLVETVEEIIRFFKGE